MEDDGGDVPLVVARKGGDDLAGFGVASAAGAGRDGGSVRASSGMIEEGADFVGRFGREDVLEFTGLLFDFGFAVHGERIGEETFSETVAANDIGGALMAARR